jgi:rubredoxin
MSHYETQHKLPLLVPLTATEQHNGNHVIDSKQCVIEIDKQPQFPLPQEEEPTVACGNNCPQGSFCVTNIEDVSALPTKTVYEITTVRSETPLSARGKTKFKRRWQPTGSTVPIGGRPVDGSSAPAKSKAHWQSGVSGRGGGRQTDSATGKVGGRRPNAMMSVFPCSICGKVFRQRRYLHKHSETHEAAHACDVCGKTYRCRAYLRLHSRRHAAPEAAPKPRFACTECDFTSDVAAAIHAHRQVHVPSDSVRCAICGGAYADRAALSKHRRVHDAARPYACPFPGCAWRFRTDVMCRAHVRAHTIAGRFQCSICGYVFRRKHHLQRHEIRMHADSAATSSALHAAKSAGVAAATAAITTTARANHTGTSSSSVSSARSARSRVASLPATIVRPVAQKCVQQQLPIKLPKTPYATDVESGVACKSNDSQTIAVEPDILLSTMNEDKDYVNPTLAVGYDHLTDDDCFTALLDMSDVELDKKNGHLIVDDFDLFH